MSLQSGAGGALKRRPGAHCTTLCRSSVCRIYTTRMTALGGLGPEKLKVISKMRGRCIFPSLIFRFAVFIFAANARAD